MTSKLVSIVIPVYNEEEYLRDCLESIKKQELQPLEVLVIDNNSTDKSVQIAKEYSFVKVFHEKKQGVVYARNCGFNKAQGKIIGRIDADTRIDPKWVLVLEKIFKNNKIGAVSGSVYYYDVLNSDLSYKFDLYFRKDLTKRLGGEAFLLGANMAITSELWNEIKSKTCNMKGVHEDLDLAIHANDSSKKVVFAEELRAGISLRRYVVGFRSFIKYIQATPETYRQHQKKCSSKFYPVLSVLVLSYWLILFSHLIYDEDTDTISLKGILKPRTKRVDPSSFME
jgi:glycosyltransferase involved in cell wall biosynthesis